jgi:hypothetical protein
MYSSICQENSCNEIHNVLTGIVFFYKHGTGQQTWFLLSWRFKNSHPDLVLHIPDPAWTETFTFLIYNFSKHKKISFNCNIFCILFPRSHKESCYRRKPVPRQTALAEKVRKVVSELATLKSQSASQFPTQLLASPSRRPSSHNGKFSTGARYHFYQCSVFTWIRFLPLFRIYPRFSLPVFPDPNFIWFHDPCRLNLKLSKNFILISWEHWGLFIMQDFIYSGWIKPVPVLDSQ